MSRLIKSSDSIDRDLEKILDGRRSFPSGHSSTAFAGMTFLALFLAGLTGAWCLTQPVPGGSLLRSKLARLTLTLLPLGFATWVAISRMEDYVRPNSNFTPRVPTPSLPPSLPRHRGVGD